MICVEIYPRFQSRSVVTDPSNRKEKDLANFFREFIESGDSFDEYVNEIQLIEKDNYKNHRKNPYERIVMDVKLPKEDEPLPNRKLSKRIAVVLLPISYLIDELYVIIPKGEKEKLKKADITKVSYPEKDMNYDEDALRTDNYNGIEGAKGYDVKETVENEENVELFWDWHKWERKTVANTI